MSRLPTLFVSHGSPMLALNAGEVGAAWATLAGQLPKPRAVLVVSAHWLAPVPTLGTGVQHATLHDYYGFPAALYQAHYPAPGNALLAQTLAGQLDANGIVTRQDPERGLDHGAWVPLAQMYPKADVPVIPISLNGNQGAAYHYDLGRSLAPLLGDDILLLASGGLTHNLRDYRPGSEHLPPPGYVTAFQDWFYQRLMQGNMDALLDYRRQAPDAVRAHPTEEHLLPLFVAMGAAEDHGRPPLATRHYSEISERILAMDVYGFART